MIHQHVEDAVLRDLKPVGNTIACTQAPASQFIKDVHIISRDNSTLRIFRQCVIKRRKVYTNHLNTMCVMPTENDGKIFYATYHR